jgi:hypothetical protein
MKSVTVSLRLLAVLVGSLVGMGTPLAWAEDEAKNSGFLGDDSVYARLQEVEIHKGAKGKRWFAPHLNSTNYQSALVDDVVLYPTPEPGPQVSAETLEEIQKYLPPELRDKIAAVIPSADAAGPGVVRIQTAVTGVDVASEGLHVTELIPVSAIFHGVQAARGKRKEDVQVFVEVKLLDGESGELVGAVVRQIEGAKLKGKKDQLTLADMQDSLNQVSDDAAGALSTIF